MHSAFATFYKSKLLPFKEAQNIHWQIFRDNKLHNEYEVELVFTMNMNHINLIYKKYSKMNQDTKWKAYNAEYVAYVDCVQLLRNDSLLHLS